MDKIACGMICKNDEEAGMLARCLNTVAPFVDGVFLTVTSRPSNKIQDICKRYGVNLQTKHDQFITTVTQEQVDWLTKFLGYKPKVTVGEKLFQFDKARNCNLEFIPDEFKWLIWLDTDDVLRHGEQLKAVLKTASDTNMEAIFLNYLYQVELDGKNIKNIIIQHLRERILRIDGNYRKIFKWEGALHETIIQQVETKKTEDQRMDVVHLSSHERFLEALQRNLKALEVEVFRTKGKDPRPIYYLGKIYYDFHNEEGYKRSEQLILKYLSPEKHERNMSGWREERAQAWGYLGTIYFENKQFNNALKCYHNSLIEYPQSPSIYFDIAKAHQEKQQYDLARFWVILGSQVPKVTNTLVSNPRDDEVKKYEVLYNAAIKLNNIDEAWASAQKLKEFFPDNKVIEDQWNFINGAREVRNTLKSYIDVVKHLNQTGQTAKIKPLLSAAPDSIVNNPMIMQLSQEIYPPRVWGDKQILIYCGPQFTPWDPNGLKNPNQTFVGGSEEAVIYMAAELSKLGYEVTVYADPEKEGDYDGVKYLSSYRLNKKDSFNTIVYWRAVSFVDLGLTAKKHLLWCHDVLNPLEFTETRLEKLDRIIVLSKAHRENIKSIHDKKVFVSTNGYYEY